MLKPIKTEKLYVLIMEEIRKLIKDQQLKPGDRLPSERAIAESLSVSRTSVRQAITALSEKGLLVIQQGSGAYISNSSDNVIETFSRDLASHQINPVEIASARLLIETEAAALCAQNADQEFCNHLKSLLDRRRIAENRSASYDEMNRDLHLAIAEGSENYVYFLLMQYIFELMKTNMWRFAKEKNMSRLEVLNLHLDQHEAIVEAICRHDVDLSRKFMSEHLRDIDLEMSMLFGD